MKKKLYWAGLLLLSASFCGAFAQNGPAIDWSKSPLDISWNRLIRVAPDSFYGTSEAVRIADNVLLYQLNSGAWEKNMNKVMPLNEDQYNTQLSHKTHVDDGTIDNSCTTEEIQFLARVYHATRELRFKEGALRGIQFLFDAQTKVGGWPQCYLRTIGYVKYIQYNDDSNYHVLNLLRDIYTNRDLYDFVPVRMVRHARKSFEKGIQCILKTQYRQHGVLSVWCAQHDAKTLQPAPARAYELVSLSGSESMNLILLLMSIDHPSAEIINAVEAAVAWVQKSSISGFRYDFIRFPDGKKLRSLVPDEDAPLLWARFYDLDTNEPFFCDRDGIKRKSVDELGEERRNGYGWYSVRGNDVLERYKVWKKTIANDVR